MSAKITLTKNYLNEDGLAFTDKDSNELYFIPNRLLDRIDPSYKLIDNEIGDVFFQVVTVATYYWATEDLLCELTERIYQRNPLMENIMENTLRAVDKFQETNKIWNKYNQEYPFEKFNGSKKEWKDAFWTYLKKKK